MARPLKEGIDYFSLDCYMDDKIKMIQAEFGLKGFAIVVKLWHWVEVSVTAENRMLM